MNKHPLHVSNLVPFLPYLYFALIPVSSFLAALNGGITLSTLLLLVPAIPFVVQLVFSFKHLDLILGIITFVIAVYLTLAYISDLVKITVMTPRAISFITGGALFVLLNFVMSVRLFKNCILKTSAEHPAV
ncbi:hypothetical protein [uncultured Chitinophaga sp.]|uniref:hypothetical protein n=1 Tax=uncultured Chitinophaga sp. TaxID=339340 RepID=UPI0025E5097E|nr:hypothetical protein [uncultured Chitinophaga sp.]